jgi:transposase
VFCEILETLAEKKSKDPIRAIDATHIKVHQDACRHKTKPEERALGKTKGGRNSKVHACVNGKGKAVKVMLIPGNEHEIKTAQEIVGNAKNKIILADRGYDSDEFRKFVGDNGGVALIPGKSNRTGTVFYIPEIGKKRRVVENFFARIKRFRRVNTRYDSLVCTYMSFLALASLADWIRF